MDLIVERSLGDLRQKLKDLDGKLKCDMSDRFLRRFLRHKNYDVQAAFSSIEKYYRLRDEYPEKVWPRGKGIEWMEPYVSLNNCTVFPHKNPRDNTRIFVWRKGLWQPEQGKYDLADGLTWSLYMMDYLLFMRKDTEDDGWTSIMDLAGFEARHVPYCDLRVIRAYASILKGALPLKVKGIHFVNVPSVFQYVLRLIKFLLDGKLRNRIFVHSSVASLTKTIDPSVLPEEYGGSGKHISSRWIFDEMLPLEKQFEARSYQGFEE